MTTSSTSFEKVSIFHKNLSYYESIDSFEQVASPKQVKCCHLFVILVVPTFTGCLKSTATNFKLHITKSLAYRCVNFFFPIFHKGSKPL